MLLDAHNHLQFAAFEKDRKEVIARALAAGISMLIVGTQQDTSRRALETAQSYPQGIYATVGLHPIHTERFYRDTEELEISSGLPAAAQSQGYSARGFWSRGEEFSSSYYRKLASDPKVLAIGECGLDYYRLGEESKRKQQRAFEQQIELAKEIQKPLMIHCRDAFSDLIRILETRSSSLAAEAPGIVHFFTGVKADAKALLDLRFAFTFGGVITFNRDYDEVIRMIPMEAILSETDSPYAAPAAHRGRRNEPFHVIEVVKRLAEIKGVSVDKMRDEIWKNARRIFGAEFAPGAGARQQESN